MYGQDPSRGMQHSEDMLRRAREVDQNPPSSRRDHRGRFGLARIVLGAIGVVIILWVLWSNVLA